MIVLVGASASGKTELAKILFNTYGYTKCITTTTREKRQGEKDDIDYHFLTVSEFKKIEENHGFLEVSLYNNHDYGIQKKDVNEMGLVIVDPNGANALVDAMGNEVYVVYVWATEDIRRNRMKLRNDQPHLIEERILNDRKVFVDDHIKRIDLKIENENHDLEDIVQNIHQHYQTYLSKKIR